MNLSGTVSFRKKATCPSANNLVQHLSEERHSKEGERIERHLGSCDFCYAEVHLLARHPAKAEEIVTPIVPEHLRLLAEALLTGRLSTTETLAEPAHEISA